MIVIDPSQSKVASCLNHNKNVIMMGKAGSGKSFLIKYLPTIVKKKVVITSTTGISALNINGSTIHSFAGIGLGKKSKEELCIDVNKNKTSRTRICNVEVLVIDEISMMSIDLFKKLEYIFRKIRKNEEFFGGVILLLSGDFLQLEPIDDFCILEDPELLKNFTIVSLERNYRQADDRQFQDILNNLRINNLTEENIECLNKRVVDTIPENCIIMLCVNKDVAKSNRMYLDSLKTVEHIYKASFKGKSTTFVNNLKSQFTSKDIDVLSLKEGARVMLTRNQKQGSGLVNGSCGKILKCFEDRVRVSFDNGTVEDILKCSWELYYNQELVATSNQLPLIIANAVSIHKCQGLTIERAYIDLSKVFCNHQIYVALSRVKSLEGVFLKNFNKNKISVNEDIIKFLEEIKID